MVRIGSCKNGILTCMEFKEKMLINIAQLATPSEQALTTQKIGNKIYIPNMKAGLAARTTSQTKKLILERKQLRPSHNKHYHNQK